MFAKKTILKRTFKWVVLPGFAALVALSGSAQAALQVGSPKALKILPKMSLNAFGFEVRTVYPSKIQGRVSFPKVAWICQGNVCTTHVKYPGFGVTACHALAMKIGPVRSFALTKQPPTVVPIKGYPFSTEQISRCNQGISSPKNINMNTRISTPVIHTAPSYNAGSVGSPPDSQAAERAKKIGEAGNRMKQAKELQRLQELGSVADQAMGGGVNGQQDCSRSANRGNCLRGGSINADPKTPERPGGRNRAQCLQAGGDPWTCMNGGRGSGSRNPGVITSGPRLQSGDEVQRRSGGEQRSSDVPWGSWHNNSAGVPTRSRTIHDIHPRSDGGPTTTVVTETQDWLGTKYSSQTTRDSDGRTIETRSLNLDRNGNFVHSEHDSYDYQDDGSYTRRHRENLVDGETSNDVDLTFYNQRGPVDGPSGQAAPDSASGSAPDNCNWNPALGKCMKPKPDALGNTSQPGPGGKNTGGILGRNTPKTDVGAAINCGDASTEACNRAGAGLSNRAKPLDHKDPGPTPGSAPH